ncbi:OLC1v1007922C1 [Oldenlandia corymbosa var. corymbosa]|uniref:OLC1v1007922C1 n=1 Tax=Oldenlandia corymbosa var. corymbosa TaxID=529605 RepID=A0AAV1DNL4_OLDCO|nr:OLC1v1007922C1 [Oldenlandia corymbosa var. corymbosa]
MRNSIMFCCGSSSATKIRGDDVPSKIEEGLYLGSAKAAKNKTALQSLDVTHILTVADSLPPLYPNDFVYKIVDIQDTINTNISQHFDECVEFIDEAKKNGGSVLVHCAVGKSRSATTVIAYLMKKRGMSLSKALNRVQKKRPVASPNIGFMAQLRDLDKALKGSRSA